MIKKEFGGWLSNTQYTLTILFEPNFHTDRLPSFSCFTHLKNGSPQIQIILGNAMT